MVMTIDEARQQHLTAVADHPGVRVRIFQLLVRAHRLDGVVDDQQGAVVDLLDTVTIERLGDDVAATDDRGMHF